MLNNKKQIYTWCWECSRIQGTPLFVFIVYIIIIWLKHVFKTKINIQMVFWNYLVEVLWWLIYSAQLSFLRIFNSIYINIMFESVSPQQHDHNVILLGEHRLYCILLFHLNKEKNVLRCRLKNTLKNTKSKFSIAKKKLIEDQWRCVFHWLRQIGIRNFYNLVRGMHNTLNFRRRHGIFQQKKETHSKNIQIMRIKKIISSHKTVQYRTRGILPRICSITTM